MQLTAPFMS